MVAIDFKDATADYGGSSPGVEILGHPTTKHTMAIGYTLEIKVMGMTQRMLNTADTESWVTEAGSAQPSCTTTTAAATPSSPDVLSSTPGGSPAPPPASGMQPRGPRGPFERGDIMAWSLSGACGSGGLTPLRGTPGCGCAGGSRGVVSSTNRNRYPRRAVKSLVSDGGLFEMTEESTSSRVHREVEPVPSEIRRLEETIARQEAALAALSADRAFRAAIIESAAEGVCVCHDTDDFPFIEFSVWNERMVEITGYTMEQINELGWYQSLYPDPELQVRARARMDRMRTGDDLKFEHWEITRSNGERRRIAISTSVLTTKDGSVHVLGLMHDLTETERLKAEANLARVDQLTGLTNRRGFIESARLLFLIAQRQRQPVTLAYIDVDDLKTVNDVHGHAKGDELLCTVGDTLTSTFRSTDAIGRLGGDEFGVALLNASGASVEELFDGLQQRLRDASPGRDRSISASIGVAIFSQDIPDIADAIRCADSLMYRAKKAGKGGLVCEEVASFDRDVDTEKE